MEKDKISKPWEHCKKEVLSMKAVNAFKDTLSINESDAASNVDTKKQIKYGTKTQAAWGIFSEYCDNSTIQRAKATDSRTSLRVPVHLYPQQVMEEEKIVKPWDHCKKEFLSVKAVNAFKDAISTNGSDIASDIDAKNQIKYGTKSQAAWGIFSEYCDNSTIHGIKYLGEQKRPILERIFWVGVFGFSIYICSFLTLNIWEKWNNSPVIVSFAEKPTFVWQIPFPSVTICPETKSTMDIFNFSDVWLRIGNPRMVTEKEKFFMEAISQICLAPPLHNRSFGKKFANASDLIRAIRDASPGKNIHELIYVSRFVDVERANRNYHEILTEDGLCYSFNTFSPENIYRNEALVVGQTFRGHYDDVFRIVLKNEEEDDFFADKDDDSYSDEEDSDEQDENLVGGENTQGNNDTSLDVEDSDEGSAEKDMDPEGGEISLGHSDTYPDVEDSEEEDSEEQDAQLSLEGGGFPLSGQDEFTRYVGQLYEDEDIGKAKIRRDVYSKWSLENGYSIDAGTNAYPYRVLSAGVENGLHLALRSVKEKSDFMCRNAVTGFKIWLNIPGEVPQVSEQYFTIPFNQAVSISIKPEIITTSEGLRHYDPMRRQCYFQNDRYLRYFKLYTQTNCKSECLANYTMKRCGCVKFSMPRTHTTPVCGARKNTCMRKAKNKFAIDEFQQIVDTSKQNLRPVTECNCLPACTSISYAAEISQMDFEYSELYVDAEPKVRFSKVFIFFKESQFLTIKRSELYGPTDFIANCGGLLGLFMGVSTLSIVELVYFCSVRLLTNLKMRKRKRQELERFQKGNEDIIETGTHYVQRDA